MTEQQKWIVNVLMRSAGTCNWPTDHALMKIAAKVQLGQLSVAELDQIGGTFLIGEMLRVYKNATEKSKR